MHPIAGRKKAENIQMVQHQLILNLRTHRILFTAALRPCFRKPVMSVCRYIYIYIYLITISIVYLLLVILFCIVERQERNSKHVENVKILACFMRASG